MINLEHPNPNTLIINGHVVEFPQRIATVIPFERKVIVHLESDDFEFGDKLVGRNLLAYGPDGKQLWRVADHGAKIGARRADTVTQPDETGRRRIPQTIFQVYVGKKTGRLQAAILDTVFTIDPENGKILDYELIR